MKLQISKYCRIADNQIVVNGDSTVFDGGSGFQDFIANAYRQLNISYPKFFKMDLLSKLGLLASEILLNDFPVGQFTPKPDMGVVLINHSSSLCADEDFQKTINPGEEYFPSPSVFVYTLPNIVIGEICIRNKILGENTFFVSEEFDAELICDYVAKLFNDGEIKSCLTGWLEINKDSYLGLLMLIEEKKDSDKYIFESKRIGKLYKGK